MAKSRIYYFLLLLAVIRLGIVSRKISIIPLCCGDILYAVMMYILIRMVFLNTNPFHVGITALLICYGIEFLQLYQADWIIALRKTLFGRYVLGQGFLWSDILAYTFGIAIFFIIEKFTSKHTTYETGFRIK